MSEFKDILFSVSDDGFVATISFNRPKKFNAISYEMFAEIERCIMEKVNPYTNKIRVLVLKSEGKHFTVGIDLKSAASFGSIGEDENQDGDGGEDDANDSEDPSRKAIRMNDHLLTLQRNTSSFENCRVPVICAISGYCIGAGIDVSSACDIRLCAKDAKFTIKEVDIGICADLGTIQRFQRIVGNDSWTRELSYTARYFDAEEALKFGFVSKVLQNREECHAEAYKMANVIAQKSPVAVNITKKSIIYSRDHTVQEGLDHIAVMNGVMLQTSDSSKAVSANFAKKIPKFAKL